jgi:hypothetical protein
MEGKWPHLALEKGERILFFSSADAMFSVLYEIVIFGYLPKIFN